jgi:ribosome-binding factor A
VLNHASGFLRGVVAKELNIRVTPKLQFFYDKTSVQGQKLSHLIDQAIAEDGQHLSVGDNASDEND